MNERNIEEWIENLGIIMISFLERNNTFSYRNIRRTQLKTISAISKNLKFSSVSRDNDKYFYLSLFLTLFYRGHNATIWLFKSQWSLSTKNVIWNILSCRWHVSPMNILASLIHLDISFLLMCTMPHFYVPFKCLHVPSKVWAKPFLVIFCRDCWCSWKMIFMSSSNCTKRNNEVSILYCVKM